MGAVYTIRGLSDDGIASLKQHAAAAGMSVEGFLRAHIEHLAHTPLPERRIKLVCAGPGSCLASIQTGGDRSTMVELGLSAKQYDKLLDAQSALAGPGGVIKATSILRPYFETIVELPLT